MIYKLKIYVKTPKNQAEKCMKTQKKALIGFNKSNKVLEEGVISHDKFYWIIPVEDDKDQKMITKRLSAGEIMIKKFYSVLIRTIDRANKLGHKFQKGIKWAKRWIVKRLKKQYNDNDEQGFISQIEKMPDEEFKDFLIIHDRKEMQELLSGYLITQERLD